MSVLVNGIISALGSLLQSELGLLLSFKDDLEDMKSTLGSVQAVLNDAEKRSFKEESVRLWLKRLKSAAYDIEDMLEFDEPPIMAHKLKGMKKRLYKIAEERSRYNLMKEEAITDQQVIEGRETFSLVTRADVLGREEEATEIIKRLLMSTTEDICIIPIVGIGGLGKTTLAKLIYNDDRIKEVFKPRIWVHAMDFNVAKLAEDIRSSAGTGNGNMLTLDSKTKGAQEVLDGKKFLIVLDDVWNEVGKKWEAFKQILQGGKKESKILVTTRSERVSSIMDATENQHKLKPLSDDVCLELFEQRAFGLAGTKDNHLASIGEEIVKKCRGVPLTANALGGMLHFEKGEAAWKKVRDNDLWELKAEEGSGSSSENEIMSSLKLSYQHMPPALKLCFVYFSSYPKAFKLHKDMLIQQWIAQRFIQTEDEVEALQIGDGYVNHLLSISFLEEEKEINWFRYEDIHSLLEVKTYMKMHDLVYDLARWVAGDEIVIYKMHDLEYDFARWVSDDEVSVINALKSGKDNAMECRYASVIKSNGPSKELVKALPRKVRALHFQDCWSLPKGIFSYTKCLRVLDFTSCSLDELPTSIYKLKQLRYLRLPDNLKEVDERIGKLYNLIYLEINDCHSLSKIPNSIGSLQSLNSLKLANCRRLTSLPESRGDLVNLVTLDINNCPNVLIPNSIGSLQRLNSLKLANCCRLTSLPESLGDLVNLVTLDIKKCSIITLPASIGKLYNLIYLEINDCDSLSKIPNSIGRLKGIKSLKLAHCRRLRSLPESLGDLVNLVTLDIKKCSIITLPASIGKLYNLIYLEINDCDSLSKIPNSIGRLKGIKSLKLAHCRRLRSLPESLGDLVNLVTLDIKKCSIITLPASIGKLYNLIYLEINDCDSLSKIPNSIGSLQRLNSLKLAYCPDLTSLPESLGNLVNLVTLNINKCSIITLPASIGKLHNLIDLDLSFSDELLELPHSIGELQKLNSLKLYYCYNLGSLPESLFNLMELRTLDVRGCAMLDLDELRKATCNMRHLKIQRDEPQELLEFGMSELELHLTDGGPGGGRHVVRHVTDAKRINLKERGGSIKSLTYGCRGNKKVRAVDAMLELLQPHQNLQKLKFSYYEGSMFPSWMMNQMESFLPNLVKITLKDISNCEHLPMLVPKLEEIVIKNMPKIRRLNEEELCGARNTTAGVASFPSLKRLELRDMDELEELMTAAMAGDDGERGASLFPCLEDLSIRGCPKLRRIHPCIPPSVKRLVLEGMKDLEEWVTAAMAGDDGERGASLFPCLEHLTILNCSNLRRIHSCILPSLKRLKLEQLRDLEEWVTAAMAGDEGERGASLFPCLEHLTILNCSKLKTIRPCIPPSVRKLSLSSMEHNLLTFVDFSNRIKYLEIQDYGMAHFRPSIRRLTSLETLKLERCIRLATFPEWLGELSQLQYLEIQDCSLIDRLPQSIQGLTALKRLRITGCRPSLLERTRKETGEDWDKICHIGEIDITRKGYRWR